MQKRLIIGLCLVLGAFINVLLLRSNIAHPPDFTQFYFAGRLVADGNIARLHDPAVYPPLVEEVQQDLGSKPTPYFFNRPAFSAYYYLPLSLFSYPTAVKVFLGFNVLAWVVLLWKLPVWLNAPLSTRIGLICFFPFAYSVGMGQDTLILTLLTAYVLCVLVHRNEKMAGILLALCLVKPHWMALIPVFLWLEGKRIALRTFLWSSAAVVGISALVLGPEGIRQYLDLLRAPTTDFHPEYMGTIRALGMNFGAPVAWAVGILIVSTAAIVLYRADYFDRLTVCLTLPLLLGPHAYWCDYSLLAITALSTRNRLIRWVILLPWPFIPKSNVTWPMVLCVTLVLAIMAYDTLARNPHPDQTKSQDPCLEGVAA